jgi:hypothetical protein
MNAAINASQIECFGDAPSDHARIMSPEAYRAEQQQRLEQANLNEGFVRKKWTERIKQIDLITGENHRGDLNQIMRLPRAERVELEKKADTWIQRLQEENNQPASVKVPST